MNNDVRARLIMEATNVLRYRFLDHDNEVQEMVVVIAGRGGGRLPLPPLPKPIMPDNPLFGHFVRLHRAITEFSKPDRPRPHRDARSPATFETRNVLRYRPSREDEWQETTVLLSKDFIAAGGGKNPRPPLPFPIEPGGQLHDLISSTAQVVEKYFG